MVNDWKTYRLGELFDFYGGMSYSRAALGNEGIYYLHYGDIHKMSQSVFDTSVDTWLPKIDKDIDELKNHALLNTGDIVFADASEDYEGIGKSVVIKNEENLPFLSGLHTIIGKDKTNILSNRFKKYFLTTREVKQQYRFLATGSSVYGLSKSNLPKVEVQVPPLVEQRKIADILTSVDSAISKTEAIIEQTEKVKKGLMQQLLTKGIGHTKFQQTEIGEIPDLWKIKDLKDCVLKLVTGRTYTPVYFEEGIPILRSPDLKNGFPDFSSCYYVSEDEHRNFTKAIPRPGDIIYIREGGSYGIPAYVDTDREFSLGQRLSLIRTDPTYMNSRFLFYQLSSTRLINQARVIVGGNASPHINQKDIEKYLILVPPIVEQNKIVSILDSLQNKISIENKVLKSSQLLKKALMQALLTGSIRVNADEQEAVTT